MAIYAANNLFKGIAKYSKSGGALLGGIIANSINQPYAKSIVDDFAERTKTQVMQYVPRSVTVMQSEMQGKTTIEAAPDSEQAKVYIELAERMAAHEHSVSPSPLEVGELRRWASEWAQELLALETGTVADRGSTI
jgi:nitrogenase iron protein NifH